MATTSKSPGDLKHSPSGQFDKDRLIGILAAILIATIIAATIWLATAVDVPPENLDFWMMP